ncbi:DRTGG domain-containing protein [Escherichia coli]
MTRPDLTEMFEAHHHASEAAHNLEVLQVFGRARRILGCIPLDNPSRSPRAPRIFLAKHLAAKILHKGELDSRRRQTVTFCARSIHNMVEHFRPSLLVTSGDRSDVIVSACLSAMNGVKLGALLLTGNYHPEPQV